MQNKKPVKSQKVMMLNPLVHGSMRITLNRFLFENPIRGDQRDEKNNGKRMRRGTV